ncbi:LOW QUALITY PROTEIN: olfactory receptor 11A1-like [Eumetopias jubatus]|uniref:LOW QUALITY PROTEIN: olfactory receptor 11A1-like n=1 Tax=Eumetopias jubatus TaxID=34886 RepID=UPI001016E235|nr:LOW QUALITY PROTEIN: olfactory receptor 11A1-like [Eumetopias jubatus]
MSWESQGLLPWENQTTIVEFVLRGFSSNRQLNIFFFIMFFAFYILIISGNILIVLLVLFSQHLHSPMYFFLVNLPLLEICYTSNIVPKMLLIIIAQQKTISVAGCLVQFYFFGSLAATECLLLAVMSYDQYLAICQPLHYPFLMTAPLCIRLAASSWICCFLLIAITVVLLSRLTFCGPNEIDHFFCDFTPLVHLSCMASSLTEIIAFTTSSAVTLVPFFLIAASYSCILVAILRIPSRTGRRKAFSTCSSHLTVVTVFYGTLITTYLVPSANSSQLLCKGFSLLYTILTPMFNPIIYTLRNRDIHEALKMCLSKKAAFLLSCCKEEKLDICPGDKELD